MKFFLVVLFFIAPPALKPKDRVWSLQNTMNIEFATIEGCTLVANQIQASLATTDTVAVRSWCFCESVDTSKKCPADGAPPTPFNDLLSQKQLKGIFRFDLPSTDGSSVGVKVFPPVGN
jgi:hypothetical protein